MKKYTLLTLLVFISLLSVSGQDSGHKYPSTPCSGGMAGIYPCNNIDLLAHMPLSSLGGGNGNDIWGWYSPSTGKEYALLGKTTGTAIIDVTDPVNPVYLGTLPKHAASNSTWRDIKVFNNYAFIGSEASGSQVQTFNLANLDTITAAATLPIAFTETSSFDFGGSGNSHNLVINETTGYLYPVGASTCSGGPVSLNVNNPASIVLEGCVGIDGYSHDAMAFVYLGPDTDHIGKEIIIGSNEDTQTIIDVSDKSNPIQLSRTGYAGSQYSHQGWVTDDHKYLLFNDELDERNAGVTTRTHVFDITDLDSPSYIGFFSNSTAAIDHNLYIKGNYVYQSNYRAGLRILEMNNLSTATMTEVAYFDVYPDDDNASFNGTWSNYPYLPSGNIIVSGIEQGLFILQPHIAPNFAIEGPDLPIEICAGDIADFGLSINSYNGFSGSVSLTEDGSPAGTTVNLTSSSLSISNTSGVPAGNYSINIEGTSGSAYHSTSVGLKVMTVPAATTLNLPADGSTAVAIDQVLDWEAIGNADAYDLEIATDAGFVNMVETQPGLTTTSADPTSLLTETTYFWRVRCQNGCGPSLYSPTFSFTTENALPVELLDFWSEVRPTSIVLNWRTASEINTKGAFVERRTADSSFEAIGWVDGAGNSSQVQTYTYNDLDVEDGVTYFYRLRLVDLDGTFSFSKTIKVSLDVADSAIEVFPNPVNNDFKLRISSDTNESVVIYMYDLSGRVIMEKRVDVVQGQNVHRMNSESLENGIYLISVKSDAYFKSKKIMVSK